MRFTSRFAKKKKKKKSSQRFSSFKTAEQSEFGFNFHNVLSNQVFKIHSDLSEGV